VIRQIKADELADGLHSSATLRARQSVARSRCRRPTALDRAVPTKKKGGFLQKFKNVMQPAAEEVVEEDAKAAHQRRLHVVRLSAMRDEAPGAGAASMSMDMDDN
jgi:hypothetical protein